MLGIDINISDKFYEMGIIVAWVVFLSIFAVSVVGDIIDIKKGKVKK